MNLKNFESEIERKIVERGLDYYQNGDVRKLEKVSEDEFSAAVFGTEKYSIYVKLKNDAITEHECDCPYDYGDVCNHKVAVFYFAKIRFRSAQKRPRFPPRIFTRIRRRFRGRRR